MSNGISISPAAVLEQGESIALAATVATSDRTSTICFTVPREWGHHLDPDCLDPFVVAALIPALRQGAAIHAAGPLSARLLFALNTAIPALAAQCGDTCRPIHVRTAKAVEYPAPPPYSHGIATLFDASLESFSVLCDHLGASVPPAHRLTHLLSSNSAAPGRRAAADYDAHLPHLADCAQQLFLPLIRIGTNLDDLFTPEDAQMGLRIRHVALALVMQRLIGTCLIPSSYSYAQCFRREPAGDLALWEPVLLPQLSTERLRVVPVGGQYTLLQRCERVARLPASHSHLYVCNELAGPRNCSACPGCARAILALEHLGQLEHYRQVFDLETFNMARERYEKELNRSSDSFWADLRAVSTRGRNRRFPIPAKLAAALGSSSQ